MYADLHDYYQGMIAVRRAHKGFRLGSAALVADHVTFLPTENEHLIIYRISALEGIDSAKSLTVLLNGGAELAEAEIPEGVYTVLAHDAQVAPQGMGIISGSKIVVEPYSATILAEK